MLIPNFLMKKAFFRISCVINEGIRLVIRLVETLKQFQGNILISHLGLIVNEVINSKMNGFHMRTNLKMV